MLHAVYVTIRCYGVHKALVVFNPGILCQNLYISRFEGNGFWRTEVLQDPSVLANHHTKSSENACWVVWY